MAGRIAFDGISHTELHEAFSRFFGWDRSGNSDRPRKNSRAVPAVLANFPALGRPTLRSAFSILVRLLPSNIRFFTERRHKIYSEDLLVASTEPILVTKDEQGNVVLDSRRFLADNLVILRRISMWSFAGILPDYLDESLVRPVMGRLWSVLKPGGMLLAFFHTKDAGPDSPCYRFHILGKDTLEMQRIVLKREARRGPTGAVHTAITRWLPLQRVFNNRHIETLFRDFASIKFFLASDNVREVLVVRYLAVELWGQPPSAVRPSEARLAPRPVVILPHNHSHRKRKWT